MKTKVCGYESGNYYCCSVFATKSSLYVWLHATGLGKKRLKTMASDLKELIFIPAVSHSAANRASAC